MKIKTWLKNNTESLKGKTVAITGATGSLGKEICFDLASLGAGLIFLNKDMDKSEKLKQEIVDKFDVNVEILQVDMENINTVKASCRELQKREFDFLILNAGAYHIPRHKTTLGYDNVYQINFISPYYMVRKLLPYLEERNVKVVAVGSLAYRDVKLNEKDIDFSLCKSPKKVYGNAKRFLMFSLLELLKDQTKVKLAITHPGIVLTNIMKNYSKFVYSLIKYPMKIIFSSPQKGCLSIIKGVFEECDGREWIGPKMFNIWGFPKKKPLKSCKKTESEKILSIANQIYNKIEKN